MTTVFGLNYKNINAAVLVADKQGTFYNSNGLPEEKISGRKIWKGKDDLFCFGHAGFIDDHFVEFSNNFSDNKYDVEKIIKRKYFPELRKLNIKRMGKRIPNLENLSSILLVSRLDYEPKLYNCYPMGEVEASNLSAIGSGRKKVKEYMDALNIMFEAKSYTNDFDEMTLSGAIKIGLEAVRRSQNKDIYSSGLDLMVCLVDRIEDHYEDFEDNFPLALKKLEEKYVNK